MLESGSKRSKTEVSDRNQLSQNTVNIKPAECQYSSSVLKKFSHDFSKAKALKGMKR